MRIRIRHGHITTTILVILKSEREGPIFQFSISNTRTNYLKADGATVVEFACSTVVLAHTAHQLVRVVLITNKLIN